MMKIRALLLLLAFASAALSISGNTTGLRQASSRAWGKPAYGLRVSIALDKTHILKGSPFIVSLIIENISGARIDLKAIPAFKLGNPSKTSLEPALTFDDYWCPVNLEGQNPANKTGLILASPSHLMVEKGESIASTIDLIRHGWDKTMSSWWPARDFDSVVSPGRYKLRLEIQVMGSIEPQWIRSNDIDVMIGNPATCRAAIVRERRQRSDRTE